MKQNAAHFLHFEFLREAGYFLKRSKDADFGQSAYPTSRPT
jgi:hypothetical protein